MSFKQEMALHFNINFIQDSFKLFKTFMCKLQVFLFLTTAKLHFSQFLGIPLKNDIQQICKIDNKIWFKQLSMCK